MSNEQCRHCTVYGDIEGCRKKECSTHDNWYARQQAEKIAELEEQLKTRTRRHHEIDLDIMAENEELKAQSELDDKEIDLQLFNNECLKTQNEKLKKTIADGKDFIQQCKSENKERIIEIETQCHAEVRKCAGYLESINSYMWNTFMVGKHLDGKPIMDILEKWCDEE